MDHLRPPPPEIHPWSLTGTLGEEPLDPGPRWQAGIHGGEWA